jgi:8-oxo-dGTP pyrophosphatase MutT (NUDIX family)
MAVAAVVNDRQEVLMMWRHRFITYSWAWELPMGLVEEGESPEERRPVKCWRRLAGARAPSSP